jgi:hypothetical protein
VSHRKFSPKSKSFSGKYYLKNASDGREKGEKNIIFSAVCSAGNVAWNIQLRQSPNGPTQPTSNSDFVNLQGNKGGENKDKDEQTLFLKRLDCFNFSFVKFRPKRLPAGFFFYDKLERRVGRKLVPNAILF